MTMGTKPAPPTAPVPLDRDRVHLVECADDDTVLLALAPEVLGRGDPTCLRWFDTVRERMKSGRVVRSERALLVFKSEDGPTYTLRPLTLDAYATKVREKVDGSPSFKTEDDLHRHYVRTFLGPR